ncbi:glycoside hydrolase [Suillus paluster]|uniref:glycoside hydrolase n=1 Tax=Suillus paluster TaxID=48578 RepID=UPI001B86F911|nr:glycoside hydrolase [Suillus paluster]KAG1740481.1 glycoside hydrolase [Suillus paluster]
MGHCLPEGQKLEKVNITTDIGWVNGLYDSPLAVRFADFATAFPAGIQVASTWNRALMRARGLALGVNIALGPMMNVSRIAQGGRNWEGFGADPFLTGESAYETIVGLQQGGEHFRTQESSNADVRTQHAIYAHPFLCSVMAGVSSVICSNNLVNGSYTCNSDKMFNNILKREYGLDMTMPGDITFGSGDSYFRSNFTDYVDDGYISMARLDDNDEDYPATNFDAFNPNDEVTNKHVNVQADYYKFVREIGAAGTVLLKNSNGALPLNKPKNMVLIGSDAGPSKSSPNQFSDQGGTHGIFNLGVPYDMLWAGRTGRTIGKKRLEGRGRKKAEPALTSCKSLTSIRVWTRRKTIVERFLFGIVSDF